MRNTLWHRVNRSIARALDLRTGTGLDVGPQPMTLTHLRLLAADTKYWPASSTLELGEGRLYIHRGTDSPDREPDPVGDALAELLMQVTDTYE